MILDTLPRRADSSALHPLFTQAFAWLESFDPATPDGKYELAGPDLVAIVQRYDTAPAETKAWESHQIFADIQYVAAGRELMLHAPVAELRSAGPYSPAKDVEKYLEDGPIHVTPLSVPAGTFCVFLPQDGHKPGCMIGQPEPVLKVVIKVRWSQ